MRSILGRTMYVLGAGASYHTGAPLLKDFLTEARFLMNSRQLVHQQSFQRIFNWIDTYRAPAYYLNLNLDNLEHVFSLISMYKEISPEKDENLLEDISCFMLETFQKCQIELRDGGFIPDPVYSQFVQQIIERNIRRRDDTQDAENQFKKDVIVTFNYDVMFDHAFVDRLRAGHEAVNYCLDNVETDNFKLLKLHGSMNWGRHNNCENEEYRNIIQIIRPNPIAENQHTVLLPEPKNVNFTVYTEAMKNTECRGCNQPNTLIPVFIPPTWAKNPEHIINVWKTAVEELRDIAQIIIVGYSLPETDTFFQYLLTLGLIENSQLFRIIVVNPDSSPDFRSRYENTFSSGFVGRGQLRFKTARFDRFVDLLRVSEMVTDLEWSDWD